MKFDVDESRFKRAILHAFFPERCPFCGKVVRFMQDYCDDCRRKVKKLQPLECAACGKMTCSCESKNRQFSRVMSLFSYDGAAREALLKMKFYNKPGYAFTFGKLMAKSASICNTLYKFDLIIAVPMTQSNIRERGYNQATLFAKSISDSMGIPMEEGVLNKVQNTRAQHNLKAKERRHNLIGAYSVCGAEAIEGKTVMLVDDVFTTGSTASECAKMLKAAGAARVIVAVICRVDFHKNDEDVQEQE